MVLIVEYAEYKKLKLLIIRMFFGFLESQADHFKSQRMLRLFL